MSYLCNEIEGKYLHNILYLIYEKFSVAKLMMYYYQYYHPSNMATKETESQRSKSSEADARTQIF